MDNDKIINKLCKCGQPNRPGQRTCQACHSAYMKSWRKLNRVVMDDSQKRIVNAVLAGERLFTLDSLIDIIKLLARRSDTR